jgi:hypothetical protein
MGIIYKFKYLYLFIVINVFVNYAFAFAIDDTVAIIYNDSQGNSIAKYEENGLIKDGLYNVKVLFKKRGSNFLKSNDDIKYTNDLDLEKTNSSANKYNIIVPDNFNSISKNYKYLLVQLDSEKINQQNNLKIKTFCNGDITGEANSIDRKILKSIPMGDKFRTKGAVYFIKAAFNRLDENDNYYDLHSSDVFVIQKHINLNSYLTNLVRINLLQPNEQSVDKILLRTRSGIKSEIQEIIPYIKIDPSSGKKFIEMKISDRLMRHSRENPDVSNKLEIIIFVKNQPIIMRDLVHSIALYNEIDSDSKMIKLDQNKKILVDLNYLVSKKKDCVGFFNILLLVQGLNATENIKAIKNVSLTNYDTNLIYQKNRSKEYSLELDKLEQPISFKHTIIGQSLDQNTSKVTLVFSFLNDNKVMGKLTYLLFGKEDFLTPQNNYSRDHFWATNTNFHSLNKFTIDNALNAFNDLYKKNLTIQQIDGARVSINTWAEKGKVAPTVVYSGLDKFEKILKKTIKKDEKASDFLFVNNNKINIDKMQSHVINQTVNVTDGRINVYLSDNSKDEISNIVLNRLKPLSHLSLQNPNIKIVNDIQSSKNQIPYLIVTLLLIGNFIYFIFSKMANKPTKLTVLVLVLGIAVYKFTNLELSSLILSIIVPYIWVIYIYILSKYFLSKNNTFKANSGFSLSSNSISIVNFVLVFLLMYINFLEIKVLASFISNILILGILFAIVLNFLRSKKQLPKEH